MSLLESLDNNVATKDELAEPNRQACQVLVSGRDKLLLVRERRPAFVAGHQGITSSISRTAGGQASSD